MRKHSRVKPVGALKAALAACVALASFGSTAQGERWFTFEVSVFSNELASDRAQELPIKKVDAALNNGPVINLTQFFDLLNIAQWPDQTASQTPASPEPVSEPLPEPLAAGEKSFKFFHHQQSREMRSTEFHYLDSPAIGVIILAQPYEVPPLNPPGSTTELGC